MRYLSQNQLAVVEHVGEPACAADAEAPVIVHSVPSQRLGKLVALAVPARLDVLMSGCADLAGFEEGYLLVQRDDF